MGDPQVTVEMREHSDEPHPSVDEAAWGGGSLSCGPADTRCERLSRRAVLSYLSAAAVSPLPGTVLGATKNKKPVAVRQGRERDKSFAHATPLRLRACLEQLRNPYWYAEHGYPQEAKNFWDTNYWERKLEAWEGDGYNAVVYWVEPWLEHGWPTFLIRHRAFPEARELTPEQSERVIEHVSWIFRRGKELGLENFIFSHFVTTTPAFAKAHGLDKELPSSSSVDYRHNLKGMAHVGVRNEMTRAFTEAAVAELFETYRDLDGSIGGMGEALPGKRSTWYREAVVPGLKRSGRNPIFIIANWMLPLADFQQDIAPAYDNTWTSVLTNGEMFTDAKPYPMAARWAEQSGVPTLFEIAHHNHEAGLPFNSPKLAYEIIAEFRKVENCKGYFAWFLRYDRNDLFRKALGYYGKEDVPYSDEPWQKLLEEQFGDRRAAEHFLKAYDSSARMPGELTAIAWVPMDRGVSQQLMLPYWYWTEANPLWSEFVSPVRAGVLLPVRHYARVVARFGKSFMNNNGADYSRKADHPGAQELIWGLGDYPTTPEAHMKQIRRLGEECLREAEEAMKTVKKNSDEATLVYNYMKSYQLLSDYYERKVLAAVSALVYSFSGGREPEARAQAERLADEAVATYEIAINFIWEHIDRKTGKISGRWDGRTYTLPELIEREKKERHQLAELFNWPSH